MNTPLKDASAPQTDRELSLIVNQKLDYFAEKMAEISESIKRIETIKFEAIEARVFELEKEVTWVKGAVKGIVLVFAIIEIAAKILPYVMTVQK